MSAQLVHAEVSSAFRRCTECGECFAGKRAFDRHRYTTDNGSHLCRDLAWMTLHLRQDDGRGPWARPRSAQDIGRLSKLRVAARNGASA